MDEAMGQNGERWSYDVFLSFRGEDVRDNFLSHLFANLVRSGINTFMDDEELKRGENISPALLKAIENSKIALVVLSKNYASSSWCLDELVHIMKCSRSDSRHMVLPVFYKVDPSDVRGQRGSFGESFDKHNSRYPESKLQQWKDALTLIANLAGFPSLGCRNEAELIDNVIRDIIRRLSSPDLHLPNYAVGIKSRVDHVKERMCFGSDDVKVIGIYGMGGIGKTTLAKAAYNEFAQRFEGTSFLENCGEYLKKPEGKVHLQRQLLSDILGGNVEGTNMDHAVKTRFRNKRVFLVLDDIEDTTLTSLAIDFSCFGPGSKIIITTRDKHLLELLDVKNIYSPEKLDDGESFELISRHAFRTSTPPEAFRLLSKELVKYCGGLPLAMKVLGSLLFNRTTSQWRSTLGQLKQNPNGDIQAKLQLSYDALNPEEKDIFLDISCFFIGMDKDYVGCILDGCNLYPDIGLAVLEERCLISFSSDNKIMMHDLLRDMGRHIVRGTSLDNYERWSRLWDPEHILDVLTNNSGTDAIEGISLKVGTFWVVKSPKAKAYKALEVKVFKAFSLKDGEGKGVNSLEGKTLWDPEYILEDDSVRKKIEGVTGVNSLKVEAFSNLRKLRLLQLSNVQLEGSYTHFPEGLRWLYWIGCPLDSIPTELNLESSAVIDLQGSSLRRLWDNAKVKSTTIMQNRKRRWDNAKCRPPFLKMLKYLDVSYSHELAETPDFTYLPNLEKLLMKYCTRLVRIHKSIGTLQKLVLLNLKDCTNLEDLPLEPYALKSLEILVLSGCQKLKRLDDALGTLTSLKDLYLDETGLQDLPSSIGYLKNLRRLYLMDCKSLFKIPDSINELISLKELDISWSSVKEIPLKFGSLPCLTDFTATKCLKQIPSSIGGLHSLLRLKLCSSPIETLPMEIGDLRFLLELDLTFCTSLKLLPENFGKLENLARLELSYCGKLRRLPESFGNLKSLHRLYMEDTSVAELPESFGNLSNLRVLKMSKLICYSTSGEPRFVEVPNWFSNLFSLEELDAYGCRIWGKIPDVLEKLSSMRILELGDNSFHSLPSSLEGLSNLRELSLNDCRELECVPPLPWKLEKLNLRNCFALKIISDLSKLEILHELDLKNCEKVADIPGLEHLTALERLYMSGCNSSFSLAVKKTLSKVSLKRMLEMSLSENRIPDWFSQGPVTFSAQPNRELRSVILAVVVAFHLGSVQHSVIMNIQAQILKLGEPLFSHPLDFYGLYGTKDDQLYIYRYSSLHPMVTMLEDGFTLQLTTSEDYVGPKVELKMYGFHLCYEGEEDLLFGAQPNDSQELANLSSTFEEGETSISYMK